MHNFNYLFKLSSRNFSIVGRSASFAYYFLLLPGFYHFFMFFTLLPLWLPSLFSPPIFFSVFSRCSCHSCNFFLFFSIRFLCASPFFFIADIPLSFFLASSPHPSFITDISVSVISRCVTFIAGSPLLDIFRISSLAISRYHRLQHAYNTLPSFSLTRVKN